MAFEGIGLPADGAGKKLAAKKGTGLGPSGADVYFEVHITQPDNSVGQVVASQPLVALPTSLTAVFSVNIALDRLVLCNTTDSNIAIEVTDGAGTPIQFIPDTILPARAFWNFDLGGIELLGGLKWKAGSAGVNGAAKGYVAA